MARLPSDDAPAALTAGVAALRRAPAGAAAEQAAVVLLACRLRFLALARPSASRSAASLRHHLAEVARLVAVDAAPAEGAAALLHDLDDGALATAMRTMSGPAAGHPGDELALGLDRWIDGPVGAPTARRRLGAWYSPPALVDGLLDLALDPLLSCRDAATLRIVDPACGSGAFLLAAGRRLRSAGGPAMGGDALARCLRGVEVDPVAVEVLRLALWLEASEPDLALDAFRPAVVVGDALTGPTAAVAAGPSSTGAAPLDWRTAFPDVLDRPDTAPDPRTGWRGGFDLVVGNPPFQGAVRGEAIRRAAQAAWLARRFDGAIRGYANPAVAFLVLAAELARPDGGRIALVQPLSTLGARDAGAARARVLEQAALGAVWVDGQPVFSAAVRTGAVVAERGAPARRVAVHVGLPFSAGPPAEPPPPGPQPWGPLVAPALGVPAVELCTVGRVADLAAATADFRDQYYALAPHVREAPQGSTLEGLPEHLVPVVTSGLLGAACCHWGRTGARLHRHRYAAPVVDRARLPADEAVAAWVNRRLVPKVVIGTQHVVPAVAVDVEGRWLPSVPVITVTPADAADLWRLAALLLSPPVLAWTAARHLGTALTPEAVKLTARGVLDVPLPRDVAAWEEAAGLVAEAWAASRRGDEAGWSARLDEAAIASTAAYGICGEQGERLLAWWARRRSGGGRGRRSGRLGA